MKANNEPRFYKTIIGLAEIHGRELSPAALKIWWGAMRSWNIDDFVAAANWLAKACEFMPKPVDFEDMRRHSVLPASQAWAQVLAILPGGYRYGGIDELTDRAVATLGGYRELAMSRTDSLDFKRRGFIEAYEDVVDVQARAGLLPLNLAALAITGPPAEQSERLASDVRDAHDQGPTT